MNNLSIKELDELQTQLVKEIQEEFKNRNIKCEIAYSGRGMDLNNRDITMYVYKDKYNYSIAGYKFNTEIKADEYCTKALIDIAKDICKTHEASAEEIYMVELLEATKCKNLYIYEGELTSSIDNGVVVDLTSIESMEYSKSDAMITFVEDSGEKLKVNLANETITWIEGDN